MSDTTKEGLEAAAEREQRRPRDTAKLIEELERLNGETKDRDWHFLTNLAGQPEFHCFGPLATLVGKMRACLPEILTLARRALHLDGQGGEVERRLRECDPRDPERWSTAIALQEEAADTIAALTQLATSAEARMNLYQEQHNTAHDKLTAAESELTKAAGALRELVGAVTKEVNAPDHRGGSGFLLARLSDARHALARLTPEKAQT